MKLTSGQVKHVAKLADLSLLPNEEEKYAEQLSVILDYIDQLNQINTQGVTPTFNVTDKNNVLAEDEVSSNLEQENVLQSTQINKNGFYVTKKVLEEEL